MILRFKGRRAQPGDVVAVYRNIRGTGFDTWSLKARTGKFAGKVVGHADEVLLRDVTFHVSEKGRQRVLAEGRKNVHAFAIGRLGLDGEIIPFPDTGVHYNPYRDASFVDDTGEPIASAKKAFLDPNGKVWAA